jgi:hypothetical protein
MFGAEIDQKENLSDYESSRRSPRGRTANDKWGVVLDSDSEHGNSDSDESETEWERWQTDLYSPRRRRSSPIDTVVPWEPGWKWPMKSETYTFTAPPADYSFPSHDSSLINQPQLTAPRRTLSSYASADSLLKRKVQGGDIKAPRPMRFHARAASPTRLARSRPLSPLAPDSDDPDYYFGHEPGLAVPAPQKLVPDGAYPSRWTSHEYNFGQTTNPAHHSQRNAIPLSMAMTTITSTVTAGPDPSPSKKAKGKSRGKTPPVEMPKQLRKQSLTVQAVSPSKSAATDNARDSPGGSPTIDGSASGLSKPGKLKLALSFAQVAASSSSRSPVLPPSSTASVSSFESPRFAHPDDDSD